MGQNGLYVTGTLEGVPVKFLVDTGASVTIISPEVYKRLPMQRRLGLQEESLEMSVADGRPLVFYGSCCWQLEIGGVEVKHEIWVANIDTDGLLGYKFLERNNCIIDAGKGQLTIGLQSEDDCQEENDCRITLEETVVVAPAVKKLLQEDLWRTTDSGDQP